VGPAVRLPVDAQGRWSFRWDESEAEDITRLDASTLLLDVNEDGKLMGTEGTAMQKLRDTAEKIIVVGDTTKQAGGVRLTGEGQVPDAVWMAQGFAQVTSGRIARGVRGTAWWLSLLWTAPAALWIWAGRRGAWKRGVLIAVVWTSSVVLAFLLWQCRLPWILALTLLGGAIAFLDLWPGEKKRPEKTEDALQKEQPMTEKKS
jgi:hypothetical protein